MWYPLFPSHFNDNVCLVRVVSCVVYTCMLGFMCCWKIGSTLEDPPLPSQDDAYISTFISSTHTLSLTHMHPLPNRGPGPPDCITDGEYVQKLCKNHHQSLSIKSILFLFPSIFLGLQTLYTRNRERVFFKADMHISLASAHHWSGLSVKLARGVRRGGVGVAAQTN